jgi:hypothetical protein
MKLEIYVFDGHPSFSCSFTVVAESYDEAIELIINEVLIKEMDTPEHYLEGLIEELKEADWYKLPLEKGAIAHSADLNHL